MNLFKESVQKYLSGGGGWAKGKGSFEFPEGGNQRFSVFKGGGSKKLCQIDSIMNAQHLYFKNFTDPGPVA